MFYSQKKIEKQQQHAHRSGHVNSPNQLEPATPACAVTARRWHVDPGAYIRSHTVITEDPDVWTTRQTVWGPSVSTVAIATIIPVLRPSLLCRIHCTRGRSINLTVSGPRRFRWLHTSHVRIQHIALSSSMEQREQHARWSNIGKACSWGAMPACLLLSNQWARASYASRSLALASW
jgi:hypothetical protein